MFLRVKRVSYPVPRMLLLGVLHVNLHVKRVIYPANRNEKYLFDFHKPITQQHNSKKDKKKNAEINAFFGRFIKGNRAKATSNLCCDGVSGKVVEGTKGSARCKEEG